MPANLYPCGLKMLRLESIQSLIRKRKLQWVAHCARRGEMDLAWKRMVREIEDEKRKMRE